MHSLSGNTFFTSRIEYVVDAFSFNGLGGQASLLKGESEKTKIAWPKKAQQELTEKKKRKFDGGIGPGVPDFPACSGRLAGYSTILGTGVGYCVGRGVGVGAEVGSANS